MVKIVAFFLVVASLFGEGKRVVIGGAGPVGLYAALRLYEEGYSVTLLSDRRDYTRRQIVGLAPPWVEFFQRLVPDDFQRLIKQGRARMTTTGSVEMILSDVEKILSAKLSRLEKRSGSLRLLKETPLERVLEGEEGALAKSGDLLIPFDHLLFAGGTRDPLVALELAVPVAVHEQVPFSVEMFQREHSPPLSISREEQAGILQPELEKLREPLREEVGRMAEIDPELARLFGYFAHHLMTEIGPLDYRFFENGVEVAVSIEWGHPFFVSMFHLMRLKSSKEAKLLQERFFSHIHSVVVRQVLEERSLSLQGLNSIETTRFFVQQTRLAEGERELPLSAAKLYAVGDALVTPHFFSRNGLELGRLSVENVIERIKGGSKERFEENRLKIEGEALRFGLRPCTKPRPVIEEERFALLRAEAPFRGSHLVSGEKGHYLLHAEGGDIPFQIEIAETEDLLYPYKVSYLAGGVSYSCFGALVLAISPSLRYTFFP